MVDEVDTCCVGRVTISYQGDFLVGSGSTNSFIHSDSSWQGVSGTIDMVGCNLPSFGRDKEEGEGILSFDFDIGFVTCLDIVYFSLVSKIELVTMVCSCLRVVEDGLVGSVEGEYIMQDESSFSG